MNALDFFPTFFCTCFAAGYCAATIWMWHARPERFERYYQQVRLVMPFNHDMTRGMLRSFAAGAPPLFFLALTVAVGDFANAREAAGNPSSELLHQVSLASILLTF